MSDIDEPQDTPAPSSPDDGRAGFLSTDIRPISIESEMKTAYLDYAMSVIVSRALPDVRDGLKPVHRRILYSMHENNYDWSKPYRKSARVVGDVIGKYHPHGDQSIYDALVRMAQDFSLRLPLLDGQGNFGSMDGDPPAAMRYTEVRMDKSAGALLADLDKDTVDFQTNYDDSETEPTVLPARFPNILVNGAGGIAVGMATNVPPHNLGEVIDGCLALADNPNLSIEDLMEIIPGPDFPTGALIMGRAGARSAAMTGRGSIIMRSKVEIEEDGKGRQRIVVHEIPYQVNKANMIEKIAELVRDKRIEGISDLRDESDRQGVRVVIELKKEAVADVVLNQLYRFSQLQTSFGANMLALNSGKPELMNLKQFLEAFIGFREEVITRRTRFELNKARDRAHVLVGLVTAVANIDEVIRLIRSAPDPATARAQLMERHWPVGEIMPLIRLVDDPRHKVDETAAEPTYQMSEEQARAILELRLNRLTALGRDEIGDELQKLGNAIAEFLEILRSREKLYEILKNELVEVKDQFATPRRSEFVEQMGEMDDEDLIQREDMVVTVSHQGYIKRVPLSTYRAQRRGGKGRAGMSTKDEDFVRTIFVSSTHTPMLFFSSRGMVYKMKVWRLPLASPQAKGRPMVNLLPLKQGETIQTVMPLPEDESTWEDLFVMFATASGGIRRNRLSDFGNVMANGKIAMKLPEDDDGNPTDKIVNVCICREDQDILLATAGGMSVRTRVDNVRVFASRNSTGVRGITLADGDRVISMSALRHVDLDTDERDAYIRQANALRRDSDGAEPVDTVIPSERFAELNALEEFVLTITADGYGKRSSAFEYRVTNRGGKGIVAIDTSKRGSEVVAAFPVSDTDQLMMVTNGGKLIRSAVDEIRIAGRNTQGVILFRLDKDEQVVSAERIDESDSDDSDAEEPAEGVAETGDETPDANSEG